MANASQPDNSGVAEPAGSGAGAPCESINPMGLPEGAEDAQRREAPFGTPVSEDEYERLKREAELGPVPEVGDSQQDESAE